MGIGDQIRAAREKRGMSQEELAKAVGISQPAIKKIESGETKKSRFLPEITKHLGIDLLVWTHPDTDHVLGLREVVEDPAYWSAATGGGGEIMLYGAAEGRQGAMIISNDPVGTVERPSPLQGVKEGYAVTIIGHSMEPEFEPGDIAFVNPRASILNDTTCIFFTNSQADDRAMVKRLVCQTATHWHLRQWNPPEGKERDFSVPKQEWPVCWRVVAKYSRR
jgi:phage repressor protein C with HTH and peptisase S24 domain